MPERVEFDGLIVFESFHDCTEYVSDLLGLMAEKGISPYLPFRAHSKKNHATFMVEQSTNVLFQLRVVTFL